MGKLGSRSGRWISTAFAGGPAYFSGAADRASALDTLIPLVQLRLPGGSPVLSASVSVVTRLANGASAARDMVLKVDTVFSIVSTFASQKTDKANKPLTAPD